MTNASFYGTGEEPLRVLFLCTHNSSRSQMAEGLLRARSGKRYAVFSAGTHPRAVHPLAVKAMAELGIDISERAGHRAKGIEEFVNEPPMDLVITVCDEAAEECPYFPRARHQEHWSFPDPSKATGSEEERLAVFRQVRGAIAARIDAFLESDTGGTVDESMGRLVSTELERHGVQVVTSVRIEQITQHGMQLEVEGTPDFRTAADLVLVAVGVQPMTDVAQSAGITLGEHQAIRVNRKMETNIADIYAAGDCVETWYRLLKRTAYLPLGTTAHKQGRIAGENALGGSLEFAGTLGTQVVKVFDIAIARTGLREDEAMRAGFDPLTVEAATWDHNVYYPGAHELRIRVTGDRKTGHLLGAQMVGYWQAEVAKRIDVFATALFHGMRIDELNDLDLSYTPPLSSPWDPIQMSAQAWVKAQGHTRDVVRTR